MISCQTFRVQFAPATEDPVVLEHVRSCDSCLTAAVTSDPDILFRSLGGQDLVPPGGVDAFVDDVMREVRLRSTETTVAGRPASWTRRLAIAATIALGVIGGAAIYRVDRTAGVTPLTVARAELRPASHTSRPAIEAYDSLNATIVEMPAVDGDDVRMVMVFDETLPADL